MVGPRYAPDPPDDDGTPAHLTKLRGELPWAASELDLQTLAAVSVAESLATIAASNTTIADRLTTIHGTLHNIADRLDLLAAIANRGPR